MIQEITTTRGNHLIDPVMHVWGGEVAVYLFLGGVVAGLMVISGLLLLRDPAAPRSRALSLLPWAAPVLLSIGMLFLWLDLENGFNAYRFYFVFEWTSPMSWGSWILLAIYPATILLAWSMTPDTMREAVLRRLPMRPALDRAGSWAVARARTLAGLNVALGAGLGIYTGLLLGLMAARPLWNSAILGPLFLTSGLSTGAAFMLLYRLSDKERVLLSRIDMGLIAIELALIAVWLIGLASSGSTTRDAMHLFFGGPYTAWFWTMVVTVGLVGPLIGELVEQRHRLVPGRFTAILVLIGGFSLRWIIVFAGQHAGWVSDIAAR